MKLTLEEARAMVVEAMLAVEHSPEEAEIIADHLMDCELRGQDYGGLARALSVMERIRKRPEGRYPIRVIKETPVSVLLDGGGQAGYLVGHRATTMGLAKAAESGIAVAGLTNTWFTGMFAHYMEMATQRGMIAMAAGSSDWRVAPAGSSEARFGTNPIAFGFPGRDRPVIMDTGVASIMISEATLARRLGQELPEGIAWTADGVPTRDPAEGLAGAFAVWGGHKGSALGTMIQLFGLLSGSQLRPDPLSDCSLFLMFMSPDLLIGTDALREHVDAYADEVRGAKPLDGAGAPRMPFDRSYDEREARRASAEIEVADHVIEALRAAIAA
ncbi:Ldh family oxidoreductase [Tropicimonas sp. IMCC34011]|uniref:Ldh family oxidoreductase n=1 Tax=Tropicimonas sp. IMCC34011 TaxID=2248759 RepID=UPI000E24982A|nr:Ldh family oxidoreductase [Tropicimonas sp. IMCC34011]